MSTEPIDPVQIQTDIAIQIATNADSSPSDLSLIVNKSVEVNRLVAAHPNATTAILSEVIQFCTTDRDEEFSHYDEQTRRIAVRHPNILIDDALRLGRVFPDDLFMNPSIDLIVADNPRLLSDDNYLDDNYLMLQAGGCPTHVLERIAVEGTRAEQAAIARNPRLPLVHKEKLTAEYFHKRDLEEILKIASQQEDDVLSDFIKMYANKSRPFCVPQFLPFDRKSSSHRLADQFFSGFPFTCAEFPWPVEKIGNHMQPVAQINLAMASELLGENLGSGLMQIWGGVESSKKVELISRLIPESALTNELDWFYPEHAPWLDKSFEYKECAHSCIDVSDYPSFDIDNCRVEWRLLGQMFYPSVIDRIYRPHGVDRMDLEKSKKTSIYNFEMELESIEEQLESARISRPSSIVAAWGERPLVLLGGYPESLGNAWSTYQDDLLFYHSLDYAVMMTIGLTYKIDGQGKPQFSVNWTCDK